MRDLKETRGEIERTPAVRYRSGQPQAVEVGLPVEEPLAVEVDGRRVAVLMRLPGNEKELAVGFCLTEGLVGNFGEILLVNHCGSSEEPLPGESRNTVRVRTAAGVYQGSDETAALIRSGCGRIDPRDLPEYLPACRSRARVSPGILTALFRELRRLQEVKRQSGGVHSAALFDGGGRPVVSFEDIGRHNALDKVAGWAAINGYPMEDSILAVTGRASSEMVAKALRVGAAFLVSPSVPTSLAAALASKYGLTLVGRLGASGFTAYSGTERIG